jgi:hypothetical protein
VLALVVVALVSAYFGFVAGVVVGSHKLDHFEVRRDPREGPIGGGLRDWEAVE